MNDNERGGRANAQIAVSRETRDLVRDQKRGGETYDDVLRRMAEQYDPDAGRGDVPAPDGIADGGGGG